MATSRPRIQLATTLSATQFPSYANDAAFVTAKGSAAAGGDAYYTAKTECGEATSMVMVNVIGPKLQKSPKVLTPYGTITE